jgi:hypothetical protein
MLISWGMTVPAVPVLPLYVIAEVLQNTQNSLAFANAFTFLEGALPLFALLLLFTLGGVFLRRLSSPAAGA